jgi:serine/threonine-protein kinase
VERLLARGGMGEAYLARDPRSGDRVLLKLPAPEVLGDVAAHARFQREGAALRRLDHPGVQRWIESGQAGLRPYVALEYVEGESLRDVLRRRGRLSADEAIAIARQLAEALAYCHARGVVHRDLKPENVILTGDGRPVLIDFGSVLLEGAKRLTFSGLSGELGTPEYMAPEQVQGKRGDARTDVYALGTLLYELLAGRPPFAAGEGEGAVQVMRRHLEDSPAPPAGAGLSAAQSGVLARALRREAGERYPSMDAFAVALGDPEGAVARGEVEPGWPIGSGQRTSASWSTALDEPQSWRDWARYVLVAVAALLCLVLVGFAAAYFRPAH